eukprot:2773845-Rhodomonas_salina.2
MALPGSVQGTRAVKRAVTGWKRHMVRWDWLTASVEECRSWTCTAGMPPSAPRRPQPTSLPIEGQSALSTSIHPASMVKTGRSLRVCRC